MISNTIFLTINNNRILTHSAPKNMCIEILKLSPDVRRVIRFRTGVYISTLFIQNPPLFFEPFALFGTACGLG